MLEEKKKKNKGTIVVIIILILIILGLGSYIVYDKVLKEEPVKVEEPKKEVVEQQDENIDDEVTVKSHFKKSITEDFKSDCFEAKNRTISLDIPYITSNKENAIKINNEIQKMMEEKFGNLLNDFENESKNVADATAEYGYVIKNNIIYMDVTVYYNKVGCSSGSSKSKNYFYDINNDKILSLQEGFESLGYNLDDLKEYGINSYEECEKNNSETGCGCGLSIDNVGYIKPYFNKQCT